MVFSRVDQARSLRRAMQCLHLQYPKFGISSMTHCRRLILFLLLLACLHVSRQWCCDLLRKIGMLRQKTLRLCAFTFATPLQPLIVKRNSLPSNTRSTRLAGFKTVSNLYTLLSIVTVLDSVFSLLFTI